MIMTDEDLEMLMKLKPEEQLGRELDRMVAEQVLGLFVQTRFRNTRGFEYSVLKQTESTDGLRITSWQELRPYSSNMSDAWDVVERMQSMGYGATLSTPPGPDGAKSDPYICNFALPEEIVPDWILGPTMPVAICRAALHALLLRKSREEG